MGGVTAGSPPGGAPHRAELRQRHRRTQAGGESGVWLLRRQGWKLPGDDGLGGCGTAGAASRRTPQPGHPARLLAPSPTRHRRPRASQQARLQSRGAPTPPQRAVRKFVPYQCPLPGAREHNPLRTVPGCGLPQRHWASATQFGRRRWQNGVDGGARGGGVSARTQAQKASLEPREPRGRGGAAAEARRGASSRLGDPLRRACIAPARYFR